MRMFNIDELQTVSSVEWRSQSISGRPPGSRGDRRRSGRESNPRRSRHVSLPETWPADWRFGEERVFGISSNYGRWSDSVSYKRSLRKMPKTDVFCLWMRILPQKVTAVAVSSGKVVHGVSLRRDEGVGSPRGHKHICNHSVFRFTRTPTRRQPDNSPPIISSNSDFYFAPTDLERELKAGPWFQGKGHTESWFTFTGFCAFIGVYGEKQGIGLIVTNGYTVAGKRTPR